MSEITNRVANSGLVSLDLEEWIPAGSFQEIDLKSILWQGLILREQDLKDFLANTDYTQFKGVFLSVFCSEEVVLPQWVYLLISAKFSPHCQKLVWGTKTDLINALLLDKIASINPNDYNDRRIVIKGCSSVKMHPQVYINLTNKLQPVAKSIMYGEPCSTVPIYKKPKE